MLVVYVLSIASLLDDMNENTGDSFAPAQLCFIDMPFGLKTDPKSGTEIDFDQIYQQAIRPAVEEAGLLCIRGDEERTGGIIHKPMFARLLLCEFVIADLTTANPNVFYELGIRHAAKPYTTIPLFATIGAPPFDVGFVRAIPYTLTKGKLTEDAAQALRQEIVRRIHRALEGPVAQDSPLFQLFQGFPGIEISHELTDVFRDRVQYSEKFRDRLAEARSLQPQEEAFQHLQEIEDELGDLHVIERGILVDLFLSYRDVSAWEAMIDLYEKFPSDVKEADLCRQQYALALNRRGDANSRRKALGVLDKLLEEHGGSAETYGIRGRIYKDMYREAKAASPLEAEAHLDSAIDAYTKGFEAEPADYYPGVNAINLLVQKGDEDALNQVDYLTPLVAFAVARRGGLTSTDYWDLATVLELALIGRDDAMARRALPRVLAAATAAGAGWMPQTTADNLEMVLGLRTGQETTTMLEQVIAALREKERALS